MKYILSLDQGTPGSRAILFDRSGTSVGSAQQEFAQIFPRPGWVEHDATGIWHSQLAVAVQAMRTTRSSVDEIEAVAITNQRETTVLRDRITGLVLDAYFSGTKLQWLLDNVPGARKRAERGELAFGTVDSWLI